MHACKRTCIKSRQILTCLAANMSLCITLFPDPNVSKPGLRREHSLTKTGRFLGKAECVGVGAFSPLPITGRGLLKSPLSRNRINGVGRGGGQTFFIQILSRFHEIGLKSGESPVKIQLKSLEVMCFGGYRPYPGWV